MPEPHTDEAPRISATQSAGSPSLAPERWVDEYGDQLFRFAAARVRDPVIAQDLVQETFLSALQASHTFAGRSSERSWLFGILRNKLFDQYRRQSREVALTDFDAPVPEEQGAFGSSGPGKDGWVARLAPKAWDTPEGTLVHKEFRQVLQSCLGGLPDKVAQVFVLREIDGIESQEVCKLLGLSPNNLWVILHRARMGLRRCLELHWFGNKQIQKTSARDVLTRQPGRK
ncbi:MAG TPA: sigma-70 family RNA polymerase sigma factor [Verrucomicrobiae bacterium]|nr:sigma-70 family RNA polymerase sigma factor [Verrucomicrobiae bacterium]